MQDLKITLVQADQRWERKAENIMHYEELLFKCADTDLILFPEMFHTGFSMNAENLAETMNDSEGILWLKGVAAAKNAAVYTSLIIKEENSFYNRGLFIKPDGSTTIYDKRKTFGMAGEDKIYTPGTSETIVEFRDWKINLQICYDLRFPEIVRNKLSEGGQAQYDLILYVANWPERRAEHWKALLKARAIENQSYVAGLNRVGVDGKGLEYSGDSALIDPIGNVCSTKVKLEDVHTFVALSQVLEETRVNLPFLKDA